MNTLMQLLAMYTDPERATIHTVTNTQTDGRTTWWCIPTWFIRPQTVIRSWPREPYYCQKQ